MESPVIVCGLGRVGRRVLEYLHVAGLPVVAIDRRGPGDILLPHGIRIVRADFRDPAVLEEAGVRNSRGVLILTSDDHVNIATTLSVRQLAPETRIIVRLYNENLIQRLDKAVHNTIALSVARLTAPLLALTALQGQGLGAFDGQCQRYEIIELNVQAGSSLEHRTIEEAVRALPALPLAHIQHQGQESFLSSIDPGSRLERGDRLLICGERTALETALRDLGEQALPRRYGPGWPGRMWRVLRRAFREMDLAVKICTAVLVGVVTFSTLIFHNAMEKTWHESLYRTVSVIATGADMRADRLEPWQQVFVSTLRLMGAALIASFTAIFTNYLIRARLSGAFEIGRIPDRGHVVVCGLGNIGFAVVQELRRYQRRVVVIEQQRDSRFMAAIRGRGVAKIIADARVLEVLRQAHAGTAAAVIASTQHDLVNLEIGLLTRDLNPAARVVVLLQDQNLACTLRETANIRFALSIPNLAAPAFVAPLFGDRVQSVFLMQNRLFAAVQLIVQTDNEFLSGRFLRVLALDYELTVVELVRASGEIAERPLEARLAPGDRATVIAGVSDLERIFRREAAPRDCSVEVTHVTPEATLFLAEFLAAQQEISMEKAQAMLQCLPCCLGNHISHGEAQELVATFEAHGAKAMVKKQPAETTGFS
jgi:Trk K+ transport system NAD-binding subunit